MKRKIHSKEKTGKKTSKRRALHDQGIESGFVVWGSNQPRSKKNEEEEKSAIREIGD